MESIVKLQVYQFISHFHLKFDSHLAKKLEHFSLYIKKSRLLMFLDT